MKKILWIFSSALLLSVGVLSTGCGTDDPEVKDPPIVTATTASPSTVVEGDETEVFFTVTATKATNGEPFKAVTVYEGSTKVSIDDLTIDGVGASANPILITSPTNVMTWEIGIKVTSGPGQTTYTVEVEDEGGQTGSDDVVVTVEAGIEQTIEGVNINLYNQAGPAGTGAIDLDTGNGTGTSDVTAELRDMGIDSLAGSGDNWRRRIGGVNGTEVRSISGFTSSEFGDIASKEAIIALFDAGEDFIPANSIGTDGLDKWGNFKVSPQVSEDDAFVVYKSSNETYYLVYVNSITENTTLGDNSDHYNVSIKY